MMKNRVNLFFRPCLAFVLDIEICLFILSFGYSLFFRRSRPVKKFVIFAQDRTGSTLLVDLLNSPQICCDGEILKERRRFFLRSFLAAKSVRLRRIEIYGFSVKIKQLKDTQKVNDIRSFLIDLHEKGWKIIYLKRENFLRQAVSRLVADHRGYRRYLSDPPEQLVIRIDCQELLRRIKKIEFLRREEEKALSGLPYLELVYEDHLLKPECHQPTLDRIFEYFGIASVPVKTDLVKITPEKFVDFIENYDEFMKIVKDAGYARFLG